MTTVWIVTVLLLMSGVILIAHPEMGIRKPLDNTAAANRARGVVRLCWALLLAAGVLGWLP